MLSRGLTTFLGVLAAVMIWGAPAQAKIIGSGFDPVNPPVMFSGDGTFFVPDSCLTLPIGFHALPASCPGVVLESASLSGHDASGGMVDLSLLGSDPGTDVTGMVLNPHASPVVVGFNTIEIPMMVDSCMGDLCGQSWFLQWKSGLPSEEEDDDWQLYGLNNTVSLFENCNSPSCVPVGIATHVTFTPEPGSLGLLLGALGAGWLARRRKAAA